MKKILFLLLCLSLLLAAGCGAQSVSTSAEETPADGADAEREDGNAAEENGEQSQDETTASESKSGFAAAVVFETTDREGNVWDQSAFEGHSLTMINFWEPWCGPCVREMPDLQELYEAYQDQGFQILGVYSTRDVEDEVDQVLEDTGVQYPILDYSGDFQRFMLGMVPVTIFVDGEGRVLRHELSAEEKLALRGVPEEIAEAVYVGSRSYAEWERIVEELL